MIYCLPSAGRAGHQEDSGPDSFIARERVFLFASSLFRATRDIHAEE